MPKPINCPRCDEYLGQLGNLEECPLCGCSLVEKED